ncbi:antA/AntB antirepressor family protein [uncultured Fusobacterium sp.]|nr:antA/AntB antirepressor family protein [uncultured Fusobacterium sp.]
MQLIKVRKTKEGQQVVSARDLWKFLDVNYDFSTWIKRRIEKI